MQRGGDAECDVFKGFCEQGHYGGRTAPTSTRQGIYAVAPSGRFLASVNTTSPERVAAMLKEALQRWRELGEGERHLDAGQVQRLEATKRFEDRYPEDGLVLAEYVRDLDAPVDEHDWKTRAWNEDHVWFTESEAGSMVPASHDVGATVELPRALVERLARLHLVDSVRGQTPPFPKGTLIEGSLRSEVVAGAAQRLQLRFTGHTRTEQTGRWIVEDRGQPVEHARGVSVTLTGRASWNEATGRFEQFELLAIGERFGATQYNGRPATAAPAAIGFAFVLAPPDQPRVAPAFWWDYGWR
ncbi:MAG TPA: hypothetical protein VFZ65_18460 [Planctomycetota bacterium]|nr:hypothetical protein [Planctomycetota bacterium]